MPIRKGWLPREGLTADPIGRLIKRTAFNPLFTLALLLAARYWKRGSDFAFEHPTALSRLRKLFYYGVFRWVSSYLDAGVLNNWTNDQYDWNREIVIVTGGAGGIGGQVVKLFAERGTKVVVLDVIPMTFEASSNVRYYKCDITSPATIKKVADQIRAEVGEPTVLINNAGVARGKNVLNSTEKDVRFTFEVNTFAHYWLAHEFLPSMIKNNHGMIVTVASLAAYLAVPNMVDYSSSKAAALSFHEGITAELSTLYNAPKVRTVVVNQGYTRTPLFKGYNGGSPFLMPDLEVDTVAEAIVKKVLSGSSGQVIVPGVGAVSTLFRAMPHWYQVRIRSKGVKLMEKWDGRQVIDVEKWKGGREAGDDVSASTVLVDDAKE